MKTASSPAPDSRAFDQLGLPSFLLSRLRTVGYEVPSPIQARTIPLLLEGHDLVGQAQTGTGKTAAFALPALAGLDIKKREPQVLVLTPTRELCIQVSEAFQSYASNIKQFSVLPIYGGQDYRSQLGALKRGPQVIVGTPGRLMDHMRRGALSLAHIHMLVLDEADEMLRMGFIDDVQWILEQTPQERQIALFSATMPAPIQRIAKRHLNNPENVEIKGKSNVASTINQRYLPVQGPKKTDALFRILETEDIDAAIVFVRTKTATTEVAEKLSGRGLSCTALNGEMPQKQREKTIDRLRRGQLDILVATDVAARGLDVKRISMVINYDIPYDTESYVHRIGRTGRAGQQGEAILFVASRERRMLGIIEKAIGSTISQYKLPSTEDIARQRTLRLNNRIKAVQENADLSKHKATIEQYLTENQTNPTDVAAALLHLYQQSNPTSAPPTTVLKERANASTERTTFQQRPDNKSKKAGDPNQIRQKETRSGNRMPLLEPGNERFRLEVGHDHGTQPGMIVGAIANEAGIDSQYIGRIAIHDDFSLIDLPEGMPKAIFKDLKQTRVCGRPLRISRVDPNIGSGFGKAQSTPEKSNRKKSRTAMSGPGNKAQPTHQKSNKKRKTKGKRHADASTHV